VKHAGGFWKLTNEYAVASVTGYTQKIKKFGKGRITCNLLDYAHITNNNKNNM